MFLSSGLYLTRGAYNTSAGGPDNGTEALNTTQHFYKSKTDTLATITTSGYFPNTLASSLDAQGFMSVNDFIAIEGSDASAVFIIQSLNPFTLSTSAVVPSFTITTFSSEFTGGSPPALTPFILFNIVKIGTFVTIYSNVQAASTTSSGPSASYSALTPLPAQFLPAPGTVGQGYFKITQNTIQSLGELQVTPIEFNIWCAPNHTTLFNASQALSFGAGSVSYFTAS